MRHRTGEGVGRGRLLLLVSAAVIGLLWGAPTGQAASGPDRSYQAAGGVDLEPLTGAQMAAMRAAPGDRLGAVAPGIDVTARVYTTPGFQVSRLWGRSGVRIMSAPGEPLHARGDVGSLRGLLAVPGVEAVEALLPLIPDAVSEGLSVMGVNTLSQAGLTGQGVKIAIVDSGFDGYRDLLGTDLPSTVTTRSFRDDALIQTGTAHGTAVAEIIHDIAPDAQLYLITTEYMDDLSPAVTYMINQGVDVANFSVGFLAGPFNDTSEAATQVNRAAAAGIVWVNSAGNYAQQHWGGNFTDTDSDGWMQFSGTYEANDFTVPGGAEFQIAITWASSAADYDLCLLDEYLYLLDCSDTYQGPGVPPIEFVHWINYSLYPRTYAVAVMRYSGGSHRVDAFFHSIGGFDTHPRYATADRSITTPGDASGALTVGAVAWDTPSSIQPYSSRGPTVDGRSKPDFVAPDEVTSASFGYRGFAGTSAASPHVAGLAALLLEGDPTLTPAEVKGILDADARDLGTAGRDNTYGEGLAQAGRTIFTPRVDLGADTSLNEGDTLSRSGSFVDVGSTSWTATVDWGEGGGPVSLPLSGKSFTLTRKYRQNGAFQVTVCVTDNGGAKGCDTVRVTIANVTPVVKAGTNASLLEGDTWTRAGSFTDPGADTWSATVDWGEGGSPVSLQLSGKSFTLTHPYSQDGAYTVGVCVSDGNRAKGCDNVTLTVANVAPVVGVGSDSTLLEGDTWNRAGSFTDPGADIWSATVDWGEGGGPGGLSLSGKSFALSHTYPQDGAYTVAVCVTDNGGAKGCDNVTLTVANVAPAVDVVPNGVVLEGDPWTQSASFTDPGADTWLATVDWGEGSGPEPLTVRGRTVDLNHFWTIPDVYTVTVTVSDSEGVGSSSLLVTVNEQPAAPLVAAGYYHSCALLESLGTVGCWGDNRYGQLGLGDTASRGDEPDEMGESLQAVDLGEPATAIAAGEFHTCALLSSGLVKCWGYNVYGQLGLGDTASRGDEPDEMGESLQAVDLGEPATAIAAGEFHTCALLGSRTVRCWGSNFSGQLGLGDTENRGDAAGEMGLGLPTVDLGGWVRALAAGQSHTCALLSSGAVKCWGYNAFGQLGLGDMRNRGDHPDEMGSYLPTVDLSGTATAVFPGEMHTCALLSSGIVKCWGDNHKSQLGFGGGSGRWGDSPDEMGSNLPGVDLGELASAVYVGGNHACVLLSSGLVKCWGYNASGQLGLGDTDNRGDSPDEMGANLPPVNLGLVVSDLSAGYQHNCAPLSSGLVKCWGYNASGQLGLGDTDNRGDSPGEMGQDLPQVNLALPQRPTFPVDPIGAAENGQITLSWQAPASDGGLAITDYAIRYRPGGTSSWVTFPDGVSATTGAVVTGLTNGTPYELQVAAVNAVDTGEWSVVIIVRDTTAPAVTPPPNMVVVATGPEGTTVVYPAATATDLVGVTAGPTCLPASGSLFLVGTTTVTCTASDAAGNIGTATFTVTVNALQEALFRSVGAYDGWVVESSESSGRGGTLDAGATTGRVGDDASDRQYRSILHFDTSSLPDDAVITAVTLKIKKKKTFGSNPFDHLGWLLVDIKSGFYYYTQELERYDFQATGSRNNVGRFTKTAPGGWYRAPLRAPYYALINLTGVTQFRLGFKTDDNDDQVADYLSFYTGNAAESDRPELIVTYYVP